MPDLTIEYNRVCAANIHWHKEVKGSKGDTYHVQFEGRGGIWNCTCPAFQFRKGDCKHIKAAKEEKCEWNNEGCWTGTNAKPNPDNTCPECGGPTEVMAVGV